MIPLERRETRYGAVTIFRRKLSGTIIYDQLGSYQSEADTNGVSLAPYVHALYDFLLQGGAQNILMIGCGGGTLATMLVRDARKVTVVDINSESFELARRYFALPPEVICCAADGKEHLVSNAARYDAIVVDAFHGNRIPAYLQTRSFLSLAAMRLEGAGMLLMNVHVQHDGDPAPDTIAEVAADVWHEVRLFDAPGYYNRNTIIAAGNVQALQMPTVRLPPAECAKEIAYELGTMRFRDWRAR